MKQFKYYSFAAILFAGFMYADYAVATSVVSQPAKLHLSSVVIEVPKDDDREEPDEGYECEQLFPFCEAN